MRILHVAAEVGPFVSVGGLSQVLYFLPRALAKLGNDVRVFTPKFGTMDETAPGKKPWKLKNELLGLRVPAGGGEELICNVKSYQRSNSRIVTYFLENREYYELRANVFGYKDDHIRFALLSRGVLEWLRKQKETKGWFPEVIHCHDWHASYLIELARKGERYSKLLVNTPIVLTVHNFTYQGNFDFKYCEKKDRDDGDKPPLPLFDKNMLKQNALKRGIMYADAITTVSPTHAREVLTEEYGEGLHQILNKERSIITGILNGLDIKEFNPAKDPLVSEHFSVTNFRTARAINKRVLQDEFGLVRNKHAFLVGYSGRLTHQKGMNLLLDAVKHLLPEHKNMQLVVLGGGDESYRQQLARLAKIYPGQVGLHLLPNFQMPRKIFSGADALLIPSLFEPGGIVALEALRYGAVPIVRRTGGLNDIVEEFEPVSKKGNGFSFQSKDAWALYGAIVAAYTTFKNERLWEQVVKNALTSDFSWEHAAKEYHDWYRRVRLKRRKLLSGVPHIAYLKGIR